MKYLASPRRGNTSLWCWEGEKEVTVACHFCWIARSPILKTQSALLRTLLHHVLQAELDIVPEVFQSRHAGAGNAHWSVHQLHDYIKTAVVASRRRLCFFIDGLDEILPESDHDKVVGYLKQLATLGHVKIIIPSRPWTVFSGHCTASRTPHMKSINKAATVRYLEKTLGPLPDFDGVSWRCQHLSTLCEHSIESYPTSDAHGGAHKLIHDLVDRSDGNFLWLSLVTRTIRKLSRMGIGLAGIEKTIDEMPDDLDSG
jgi:hypothetical protein